MSEAVRKKQLGNVSSLKKNSLQLSTFSKLSLPKTTIVFDTYWHFAFERQNIFYRKLKGQSPPWTEDNILNTFKFTNAYRASDRVSQYLIRHVIYQDDMSLSANEIFFRIILFKIFNKIETWEKLESELETIRYSEYNFEKYDQVLTRLKQSGQSIYSSAYIMPSGSKSFGHSMKHRNHLALLEKMMKDELPQKIAEASSMSDAFDLIRSYPSIGNFLAYQLITDINYSNLTDFSEMDFVMPGPGALDGIHKCFADKGDLDHSDIIKFVTDRQDVEFEKLNLGFLTLWGRRLQLIDCQNLFCEVDKYSRVHHPEFLGISGRTRIKQKYCQNNSSISYWYPPKWKINNLISKSSEQGLESF